MAADRTVTAGFAVVAERSGSAPAGSTPDRQWPFVFDQDGVSLGFVAYVVLGRGKPCMITFVAGVCKGSGRRCWINSPNGNVADKAGYQQPSAGCIDSQTIKTATQGKTTGYDAGKKIQGRKRHLLVDTSGLLRQVVVTAADVDDRDGLKQVLTRYSTPDVPRLRKLWVDGGYQGRGHPNVGSRPKKDAQD